MEPADHHGLAARKRPCWTRPTSLRYQHQLPHVCSRRCGAVTRPSVYLEVKHAKLASWKICRAKINLCTIRNYCLPRFLHNEGVYISYFVIKLTRVPVAPTFFEQAVLWSKAMAS